jgi:hypothetical protein
VLNVTYTLIFLLLHFWWTWPIDSKFQIISISWVQRIYSNSRPCVTFCNMLIFTVRDCYLPFNPQWKRNNDNLKEYVLKTQSNPELCTFAVAEPLHEVSNYFVAFSLNLSYIISNLCSNDLKPLRSKLCLIEQFSNPIDAMFIFGRFKLKQIKKCNISIQLRHNCITLTASVMWQQPILQNKLLYITVTYITLSFCLNLKTYQRLQEPKPHYTKASPVVYV